MNYSSYKFRIYPNKLQQEKIEATFKACCYVWNALLEKKIKAYERRGEFLTAFQGMSYLTKMKTYTPWLNNCNRNALDKEIENLQEAYKSFFRRAKNGHEAVGFPKFKKCVNSYRTTGCIHLENNYVKIPNIGRVKKGEKNYKIDGEIVEIIVLKTKTNKYFAVLHYKKESQEILSPSSEDIGLDMGIKEFMIDSNGHKYEQPFYLKKNLKKLKREQRKLSRKKYNSKNYKKQKQKIRKIYEKIVNQRNYFLHCLSKKIINKYQNIFIEDLSIKEMEHSKKIRSNMKDIGWYTFTEYLLYKSLWYGRTLKKINRFYPSSQICSTCGYKNTELKNLNIRTWECPLCRVKHDRDINATKNILLKGKKDLTK